MPDLDTLIEIAIAELARRPDERKRTKEILRLHEEIQGRAPGVVPFLLELEGHVNAREATAIEVALVVGIRAGRADAHAADLDDDVAVLVKELAVLGLDLPKVQRLQAMVEVLALDLSTDDDTDF